MGEHNAEKRGLGVGLGIFNICLLMKRKHRSKALMLHGGDELAIVNH
jgi:hypothetical protein